MEDHLFGTAIPAAREPRARRTRGLGKWVAQAFFSGVALLGLWLSSEPGVDVYALLAGICAGAVAVLLWLCWTVVTGVRAWRGSLTRRDVVHWLVPVALFVVIFPVASSGAAFRIRFELSRGALDAFAAEVAAARKPIELAGRRVGLYHVGRVERVRGAVRIQTSTAAFGDVAGFAYGPRSAPPYVSEDSYRHISGPWYLWNESW